MDINGNRLKGRRWLEIARDKFHCFRVEQLALPISLLKGETLLLIAQVCEEPPAVSLNASLCSCRVVKDLLLAGFLFLELSVSRSSWSDCIEVPVWVLVSVVHQEVGQLLYPLLPSPGFRTVSSCPSHWFHLQWPSPC